jgi:hypothetical protein
MNNFPEDFGDLKTWTLAHVRSERMNPGTKKTANTPI